MAPGSIGVVVDSSVCIKWFCLEEETDKALFLRESYIKGTKILAIPDLILYEVAYALRHNKKVQEHDVQEAVESMFKLGVDIIVPTTEMLNSAITLAFAFNITVYDAVFLALADILSFECITADEKLYQKTKTLGYIRKLEDITL